MEGTVGWAEAVVQQQEYFSPHHVYCNSNKGTINCEGTGLQTLGQL